MVYEGFYRGRLHDICKTFKNGDLIPTLGFGTGTGYFGRPDDVAKGIVVAFHAGYRLIDTAQVYETENGVGEGIIKLIENEKMSDGQDITRQDIFLETKVGSSLMLLQNQPKIRESIMKSLERIHIKTLDLMLLHTPGVRTNSEKWLRAIAEEDRDRIPKTPKDFHQARIEAWEVLQQCKDEGMLRHIGVSNWNDEHLSKLLQDPRCKTKPELNQIENHPYHVGQNVINFCNKNEILIQAYGPLGNGRSERAQGGPEGNMDRVMDDPTITQIASENDMTIAQVCIKWAVQKGILPVIKSENEGRLKENIDALKGVSCDKDPGKRLSEADVARIDKLNKGQNIFLGWYNML